MDPIKRRICKYNGCTRYVNDHTEICTICKKSRCPECQGALINGVCEHCPFNIWKCIKCGQRVKKGECLDCNFTDTRKNIFFLQLHQLLKNRTNKL